ncbi:MAG: nicotinate phosphoribosyltransferase [Parcubacteria group bacterium]|nr:nicotinate phosphoribosyltransferase [Parcubacteria group bacterium]
MDPKDLAERLRASWAEFNPPVRSLLDADFYKFTMGQFIHHYFPDTEVTFKLIVRDPKIPISEFVNEEELRRCLDYAMGLRFSPAELDFLKGINLYKKGMFKDRYMAFLEKFRLSPYQLKKADGAIELVFCGRWTRVSLWETIALAIISELYYRGVLRNTPQPDLEKIYQRAEAKIVRKIETLAAQPRVSLADFGQRRRHSFLWQEFVVGLCRNMLGKNFTGTSNTWMAMHHNLPAIGTIAHEPAMVLTALANSDERMRQAQYHLLELWQEIYGQGLRVFLPDTYGSEQFFAGAPEWLKNWTGQRQDSGDPKAEGERYCQWLKEHGVDPTERLTIFSDGLDVEPMVEIGSCFEGRHQHAFGWGTLLTNDFAGCDPNNSNLRPFSMVCKVVAVHGRSCVKLSNNPGKATGPKEEVERYLKVFGDKGRKNQTVVV